MEIPLSVESAALTPVVALARALPVVAAAPAPASPPPRPKRLSKADAYDAAESEIEWLYSDESKFSAAEVVRARAQIEAWVEALPPWHRGAIALSFDERTFPPALEEALTSSVALVVRLECIAHPSIGTRETLERAALERLEQRLLRDGKDALIGLDVDASSLFDKAIRALAKVRGRVPSVIPEPRVTPEAEGLH